MLAFPAGQHPIYCQGSGRLLGIDASTVDQSSDPFTGEEFGGGEAHSSAFLDGRSQAPVELVYGLFLPALDLRIGERHVRDICWIRDAVGRIGNQSRPLCRRIYGCGQVVSRQEPSIPCPTGLFAVGSSGLPQDPDLIPLLCYLARGL